MKRIGLIVCAIFSSYVSASVEVTVKNNSDDPLELISVDTKASTYTPALAETIRAGESSLSLQVSTFPGIVEVVDFSYKFGGDAFSRCHFRYVVVRDRSGAMIPQPIEATGENGNAWDFPRCSGKIIAYDIRSGDSVIEFTADRIAINH